MKEPLLLDEARVAAPTRVDPGGGGQGEEGLARGQRPLRRQGPELAAALFLEGPAGLFPLLDPAALHRDVHLRGIVAAGGRAAPIAASSHPRRLG